MKLELQKFALVNEEAEKNCEVEFIPKRKLPRGKQQQIFGFGVLGYKVNGIKNYPKCKWMAIPEPAFVNHLRQIQNQRISV